ncbi:SH3 domain-containing protein [Siminovitchia sp. FSL W7-1587]|uniref:SH3 domain-containing protein n=1 Tax=Siminovitchia sp. FSL W7-1587 TaxID=2954699 RepID=UPI0030CDC06B
MKKKLIIPGLCFAALSTTAFQEAVQAAEPSSVLKSQNESKIVSVNSGSVLNLRSTPSTSGSVIARLSRGTKVSVLSESNGWAKVTANGKTGYVSSQYLSSQSSTPPAPKPSPSAPGKTTTKYVSVNPGSNLNLRSTPSTSGSVIGRVSNGTKVSVLSESNGWAKVTANGKTGYVSSQYLSSQSSTPPAPKPSPSAPGKTTTKYVSVNAGSNLNLRSTASTRGSVIGKLSRGTQVSVLSESNGWAKVTANGKTGYVSSQYLSSQSGSATPSPSAPGKTTTKYVSVNAGSNLNLRSTASTRGSVIGKLSRGTQVSVLSESNGWAKVTANGKTGYVSSQYLSSQSGSATPSPSAPGKTITKYVSVNAGSNLNLRSTASTRGSVIGKLSRGTQVSVLSESNGWAKVTANGKTGYVSSQYLSSQSGSATPSPSAPGKTTTKYVSVNAGSNLNLRSTASTRGSVIGKLSRGTQVSVLSESNGWAKVTANGKTGYVSSQYLSSQSGSATPSPSAPGKTTTKYVSVNPGSNLNLRSTASTRGSVIGKLSRGTQVSVISESNGWAKVTANGRTGYVSSQYLSSQSGSATPSPSAPGKTITKYVSVNAGSNLNLRSTASTRGSVIGKLSRGTQVSVISESNGWAKVTANGRTGYVSSQYLSSQSGSATPSPSAPGKTITKYVSVNAGSNLNLRSTASTRGSVIGKLSRGTQVSVLSESNGWAKVTANGKTGYVSSQYLSSQSGSATPSPSAPGKTITKYVSVNPGSNLNLRSTASTRGSVIGKLSRGTQVSVLSESNGWAKVTANGKTGYVSSQYLSSQSGAPTAPTPSPSAPGKTITKYVNHASISGISMHTKPSSQASVMVNIASGVPVLVYSEENGWAKIRAYGKDGYVQSKYLAATPPATGGGQDNNAPGGQVKYVNINAGSNLNLRSSPSLSASVIAKLANGTVVNFLSEKDGWAKVSVNGKTGYVSSQYLSAKLDTPQENGKGSTMYSNYDLTLDEMVKIQMAAKPQTDKKYQTYIRADALKMDSRSSGIVQGSNWNVRGGAGTNFWTVGQVQRGTRLKIISSIKGTDGHTWYQVQYNKTWVNASPDDVRYYVDPNNFVNDPVKSLQFINLSKPTHIQATEVNQNILYRKGILSGKAAAFIRAGQLYGVNELYLISHALLETGNGSSRLANGVKVNGRTVYNMYGIGAKDGDAVAKGAQFAYNAGWFTPEDAIIGGAKFIAQGYIGKGQNTIYKMRWNPAASAANGRASHQYATDIGWAVKQINQIHNLYSLLGSYKLIYDIPVYKKM